MVSLGALAVKMIIIKYSIKIISEILSHVSWVALAPQSMIIVWLMSLTQINPHRHVSFIATLPHLWASLNMCELAG